MKFFLDTSSINQIQKWSDYNLVEGVTTNPSLLSKEDNDPVDQLKKICKIVKGPVSAQVTKSKSLEMIKQALILKKISKNIIIKLPANSEGFFAAQQLKKRGIKLNITVGFNPTQIIPFAKIDVDYFSLIYGKTEDWGFSNLNSILETKNILKSLNSTTKLLLASIRNENHLKNSILNGSDAITVPPSTWEKVFENKYSSLAIQSMMKDWKKIIKSRKKKYET